MVVADREGSVEGVPPVDPPGSLLGGVEFVLGGVVVVVVVVGGLQVGELVPEVLGSWPATGPDGVVPAGQATGAVNIGAGPKNATRRVEMSAGWASVT